MRSTVNLIPAVSVQDAVVNKINLALSMILDLNYVHVPPLPLKIKGRPF